MNKIQEISEIPESPGVYIFKDVKKKILYVGKAINLKSRVKSYFTNIAALSPKTKALVLKIADIEHIKVENEIEALLLEAELIKRYKPPYNMSLKDDKFYKFIKIEKSFNIYKVGTARKIDTKAKYYGPFPEASSVDIIIKTLRRVFPYRDCSNNKF